ncbi:phasin family protein [Rhodoplanes sp. SY1]|uniref:phasin family protein n=1 Tax=Rhodoplanes sp. SY1 TaxID=3166646 RepID=UPI0038B43D6D
MPAKTPTDPPGEMPGLPPLDYPSSTGPSGSHGTGTGPSGARASAGERAPACADQPAGETGRAAPEPGADSGPDPACGPEDADQAFTDQAFTDQAFSEALHDGAEFGRKMLAAFETNLTAGFGFAAAMAETTSVPDMIALSSRFAARQLETALVQGKDLWTTGEKVMSDAARGFAPAGGDDPEDAGRR